MKMLKLKSLDHYESLRANRWGIREVDPAEADALEEAQRLDLILVPGLCFDTRRQRLGHGRGYYDRYISLIQRGEAQGGDGPLTG